MLVVINSVHFRWLFGIYLREEYYKRNRNNEQILAQRKLHSLKMIEDESLSEHLLNLTELFVSWSQLSRNWKNWTFLFTCSWLLSSYDTITTVISAKQVETLNLEYVKGKLLHEELKQKGSSVSKVPNTIMSFQAKTSGYLRSVIFHNCRKFGVIYVLSIKPRWNQDNSGKESQNNTKGRNSCCGNICW